LCYCCTVLAGYLLKFLIPKGCRNGACIYRLARIEEEREVLVHQRQTRDRGPSS